MLIRANRFRLSTDFKEMMNYIKIITFLHIYLELVYRGKALINYINAIQKFTSAFTRQLENRL